MDTTWTRVGKAVRTRRAVLGLKQKEAAALAGVGSTTWSELERGVEQDYRATTLAAIAKALRWPPDALSYMADDPNYQPPSFDPPTGTTLLDGPASWSPEEEREAEVVQQVLNELLASRGEHLHDLVRRDPRNRDVIEAIGMGIPWNRAQARRYYAELERLLDLPYGFFEEVGRRGTHPTAVEGVDFDTWPPPRKGRQWIESRPRDGLTAPHGGEMSQVRDMLGEVLSEVAEMRRRVDELAQEVRANRGEDDVESVEDSEGDA